MGKEGWTWFFNSPKWHYLVDGRSLCGRWMSLGSGMDLEQGNDNSPDNCKACIKKLQKRKEKMDSNKGFVLVTALMFVLIITVLSTMGMLMVTGDLKVAAADRSVKQNFYLAEAGLQEAKARLQGFSANQITDALPNDPVWALFIGDGSKLGYVPGPKQSQVNSLTALSYSVKVQHKLNAGGQILYWNGTAETTTVNRNIYVITSMGYDSNGHSKKIQIEVVPPDPIIVPAAFYSELPIKQQSASAVINGVDQCGTGGKPAIIGTCSGKCGSPEVIGIDPNNPVIPHNSSDDIDVANLINRYKPYASASYDVSKDTLPSNFGDPVNKTNCKTVYIKARSNGTTSSVNPPDGCGLLLIDGDMNGHGGFQWYGLIVVNGSITLTGGGNPKTNVTGAIIGGGDGLINESDDKFQGSEVLQYCSSAIKLASSGAPYKLLRWTELFN